MPTRSLFLVGLLALWPFIANGVEVVWFLPCHNMNELMPVTLYENENLVFDNDLAPVPHNLIEVSSGGFSTCNASTSETFVHEWSSGQMGGNITVPHSALSLGEHFFICTEHGALEPTTFGGSAPGIGGHCTANMKVRVTKLSGSRPANVAAQQPPPPSPQQIAFNAETMTTVVDWKVPCTAGFLGAPTLGAIDVFAGESLKFVINEPAGSIEAHNLLKVTAAAVGTCDATTNATMLGLVTTVTKSFEKTYSSSELAVGDHGFICTFIGNGDPPAFGTTEPGFGGHCLFGMNLRVVKHVGLRPGCVLTSCTCPREPEFLCGASLSGTGVGATSGASTTALACPCPHYTCSATTGSTRGVASGSSTAAAGTTGAALAAATTARRTSGTTSTGTTRTVTTSSGTSGTTTSGSTGTTSSGSTGSSTGETPTGEVPTGAAATGAVATGAGEHGGAPITGVAATGAAATGAAATGSPVTGDVVTGVVATGVATGSPTGAGVAFRKRHLLSMEEREEARTVFADVFGKRAAAGEPGFNASDYCNGRGTCRLSSVSVDVQAWICRCAANYSGDDCSIFSPPVDVGGVHVCPTGSGNTVMCPDGTCVSSALKCSPTVGPCEATPATPFYCEETEECLSRPCVDLAVNPCTAADPSRPVQCFDGSCVASLDKCPTLPACAMLVAKRCGDGSCIAVNATCPPNTCTANETQCADGRCVPSGSACAPFDGCSPQLPIQCKDFTCAASLDACRGSCGAGNFTCFDGQCAPIDGDCPIPPSSVKPVPLTVSFSVGGTKRAVGPRIVLDAVSGLGSLLGQLTIPEGSYSPVNPALGAQTAYATVSPVPNSVVAALTHAGWSAGDVYRNTYSPLLAFTLSSNVKLDSAATVLFRASTLPASANRSLICEAVTSGASTTLVCEDVSPNLNATLDTLQAFSGRTMVVGGQPHAIIQSTAARTSSNIQNPSDSDSDGPDVDLIVGLVVGLGGPFLIAVVVIAIVLYRRRSAHSERKDRREHLPTVDLPEVERGQAAHPTSTKSADSSVVNHEKLEVVVTDSGSVAKPVVPLDASNTGDQRLIPGDETKAASASLEDSAATIPLALVSPPAESSSDESSSSSEDTSPASDKEEEAKPEPVRAVPEVVAAPAEPTDAARKHPDTIVQQESVPVLVRPPSVRQEERASASSSSASDGDSPSSDSSSSSDSESSSTSD